MKGMVKHFSGKVEGITTILFGSLVSFVIAAFIGVYAGFKWYHLFSELANFIIHEHWILLAILFCCFCILYPYFSSYRKKRHYVIKEKVSKLIPLRYDNPTDKDEFERIEYAKMLANKILASFQNQASLPQEEKANVSMVINIEEDYGFGKSSFLLLLKKA